MRGILKRPRSIYFLAVILLVFALAYTFYDDVFGATYTWDGGGASNLWSDCANWTSDTCPGSNDIAAFDGTSVKDSIVNATATLSIAGVTVNSGYTGIITQEADLQIVSGNFDQAAGTWRQGTTSLDIDYGGFTLSGGTFLTGVGTTTVDRDFTLSGGTYTASSTSIVDFTGTANHIGNDTTVTCTGGLPELITISKPATGQTFTLGSGCNATTSGSFTTSSPMTINGTLHIAGNATLRYTSFTNNGTTTMDGTDFHVERNFTQNGYFRGSTTATTIVDLTTEDNNGTNGSTLSCTGDFAELINISKTSSGQTVTIGSGCNATTTSGFTLYSTLTVNGSLHVNGNVAVRFATFTNTGTTTIDGTDVHIERDFTQNGYFRGSTTATTIVDFSTEDAHTGNDSTLSCTGDFGEIIDVSKTVSGQTFTLAAGCNVQATTVTNGGPMTINGTFDTQGNTLTASTLTVSSDGILKVTGNETLTTPTLNTGSTVEYIGASTYSTLIAGTDYEHLSFTGGGTYNITDTITVAGNFSSTNNSNFNQTTGSTILDGTSQIVTGTSTFYILTKTVASAATLTFGANQTQTISSTLTLQGASGNLLSLRSSSDGTQYKIDMQGLDTLEYLDIKDANNIDATTVYCSTGCTDSLNNTNISFGADPDGDKIYWDNGGADSNWSTCANWKNNVCPTITSVAAFDSRSTADATLDASFPGTVLGLSIENGYTGTITSNRSLIVGRTGFTQADGTFTAPATTLTVAGNFTHTGGTFSNNSGTVITAGTSSLAITNPVNNLQVGSAGGTGTSTLVAYWSFNETSAGTFADTSGNSHNGTGLGSGGNNNTPQPDTETAPLLLSNQRSLDFDGTDDYVSVSSLDSFEDAYPDFTIAGWFYVPSGGGGWALSEDSAAFNKEWRVNVSDTTVNFTYVQNNGTYVARTTTGSPITADAWNHVAWVVERGTTNTVKIYVNGSEETLDGSSVDSAWDHSNGPFRIGFDRSGYFTGKIDHLQIYSTNLAASYINDLANGHEYIGGTFASTTLGTDLDINGDVSIASGSELDVSATGCGGASCDIQQTGNFTNDGTFTPRTGTVAFDGTNQTIGGNTATTTFYDFTRNQGGGTLTFQATNTIVISNTLTLRGTENSYATVVSTAPGTYWYIKPTGTVDVQYVGVTDSYNLDATAITCDPCTDSGNNINWDIVAPQTRQFWRLNGGTRLWGNLRFGGQ